MKKIIFVLLILFIQTSFKTYAAAEFKIANIKENQQVSGSVLVKLKADNLSDFKKISYCLNGRLLFNLYDEPFIMEWDSRDFENGTYELSVRGIHPSGIVLTDRKSIMIENPTQPFKIIIDNPKKIVSREQNNYRNHYIDSPHTMLKKNDSAFYFFHTQGLMMHEREKQGIMYRSSGTYNQPLEMIESGNYVPEVWDKGEHKTEGIWLMGVYQIGNSELLGFTHNESCYEKDIPCNSETKYFSLGVGYSRDNGKSWQYCGDIIRTPRYGKEGDDNIKGVPYIIKGEYFYIYFWEFPQKDVFYPAVARAKISEVINAARKGENVEWNKYKNGDWDQDGMTGVGTNIMSNLDKTFNMHCKVSYVPSIKKYLMITYENGKENVFILLSDDGLTWEISEKIMDYNTGHRASYPFIADSYTVDGHQIDNDFYIYWAKNYRDIWGAKVTIKINEDAGL